MEKNFLILKLVMNSWITQKMNVKLLEGLMILQHLLNKLLVTLDLVMLQALNKLFVTLDLEMVLFPML